MEPNGANPTNLMSGELDDVGGTPDWSPDGTKIAYARDGIWVMNANGSNKTQVTSGGTDGQPAWSPYGSKLIFNTNRDGNEELYVAASDGTGQQRLTIHPGPHDPPTANVDTRAAWAAAAVPAHAQQFGVRQRGRRSGDRREDRDLQGRPDGRVDHLRRACRRQPRRLRDDERHVLGHRGRLPWGRARLRSVSCRRRRSASRRSSTSPGRRRSARPRSACPAPATSLPGAPRVLAGLPTPETPATRSPERRLVRPPTCTRRTRPTASGASGSRTTVRAPASTTSAARTAARPDRRRCA